jgi:hypothetical protein
MLRIATAIIACMGLSAALGAQQSTPAHPDPVPVAARIADVAWLQGYWIGEGLGGVVEDVWMPPREGVMLGAFRVVKADGSRGFYELFAVEEAGESLRFVAKHFHPDWVGWEEKDKALSLRLTRLAPGEAVFGGVGFRLEGTHTLVVELSMRGREGAVRKEVLRFARTAL